MLRAADLAPGQPVAILHVFLTCRTRIVRETRVLHNYHITSAGQTLFRGTHIRCSAEVALSHPHAEEPRTTYVRGVSKHEGHDPGRLPFETPASRAPQGEAEFKAQTEATPTAGRQTPGGKLTAAAGAAAGGRLG
jgi:hypothetical protein